MKSKQAINGIFYDVLESLDSLVEIDYSSKLTEGEIQGLYTTLRQIRQGIRSLRKHVGDLYETR